ncbi:uncharacterized protein [Elaeis guineensis]
MDFFKSVFAADPDPDPSPPDSPRQQTFPPDDEEERGEEAPAAAAGGAWSFGGLIKTIATKKEFGSLIETYRRDLEEFGSGLKKETAAIREAATRAVQNLPGSLEAGASVAQESLESVGQVIDDFGGSVWQGTTEIISQSKEVLLAMESDANSPDPSSIDAGTQNLAGSSRRYSRFDAQVLAIQSDLSTFSEEPEDAEDFKKWRSGFQLAEKEEEVENLCYENGALEGFLEKLVPSVMDYDTFWSRYYYRIHKLKQAEDARAKLVKRVISREEDEEDLSWEVDDDEEEEEKKEENIEEKKEEKKQEKKEEKMGEPEEIEVVKVEENKDEEEDATKKEDTTTTAQILEEKKHVEVSQDENLGVSLAMVEKEVPSTAEKAEIVGSNSEELISKPDDKVPEAKTESGGSCKDSDVSVVSRPSMPEEDDLEWDEIEDLGEHDDKKISNMSGSPLKVDLRKRLSAAEDDEDLSWDIEDDVEPAKP